MRQIHDALVYALAAFLYEMGRGPREEGIISVENTLSMLEEILLDDYISRTFNEGGIIEMMPATGLSGGIFCTFANGRQMTYYFLTAKNRVAAKRHMYPDLPTLL